MRPNTGALRTPVRSEGFVVLFPLPEGGAICGSGALESAGIQLSPLAALTRISEARIHRIRCFRLASAQETTLSVLEEAVLVVCAKGAAGEGLVLDGARMRELVALAPGEDVLLLVFPRAILPPLVQRRLAGAPPMALWPVRVSIGAPDSAFGMLMTYVMRLIEECPDQIAHGEMGAQMEESLAVELLRNWVDLADKAPRVARASAVPRHVRLAESFMQAHAAASPSIAEIARAAGVSERVLSAGFRQFRGVTPSACLRELRLNGVRAALERAGRGETVASVAANWSYVNFGLFARAYAHRFGELPSQTLRRARGTA